MLRRRPAARREPPRQLRRAADGTLTATDDGQAVSLDSLRESLLAGRYFRVTRADTGADCTNEVLAELIRTAVPDVDATMFPMQNPLLRLLGEADGRS